MFSILLIFNKRPVTRARDLRFPIVPNAFPSFRDRCHTAICLPSRPVYVGSALALCHGVISEKQKTLPQTRTTESLEKMAHKDTLASAAALQLPTRTLAWCLLPSCSPGTGNSAERGKAREVLPHDLPLCHSSHSTTTSSVLGSSLVFVSCEIGFKQLASFTMASLSDVR